MYQIPKGLYDILPYGADENWKLSYYWQYLEEIIKKIALDYSFKELRTPIFEKTEVFIKSAGETSDIVKKEMYTFKDKADRLMTLRPEGTAAVMRAFVENNLQSLPPPYKFYYIGPMFRYDRPQAGRYRQHYQFGIEAIGSSSYFQDVEVIDLLMQLYRRLGLKNLTLNINSVGDIETRQNYKKELQAFLKPHFDELSKESQERFSKNPLRILDSKEEEDKKFLQNIPSILDFLSPSAKKHFADVCASLKELDIDFVVNEKLVRGLDYYNHTVFEVVSGKIGSQNSLGGGGRYDGLVKSFGGPDLSAFGFGTGMERIIQTMIEQNIEVSDNSNPFIYFIPLDESSETLCFKLTLNLRHLKVPVENSLSVRKLQKSLQTANYLKAKYAVIIGENELKTSTILLKDLEKREQSSLPLGTCLEFIKNLYEKTKGQKNV